MIQSTSSLIRKYAVPGPRYTSYPTVPFWENNVEEEGWKEAVRFRFREENRQRGMSIYIHLPYCESLCTYCGCNKRITKNHQVERPYIEALLKEWALYMELFGETPRIREIHLGGGTPTFFSPAHLRMLIEGITAHAHLLPDAVLSFEAHPASTTLEHLMELYALGFRRLSLGIQDFEPEVQKAIHRIQTYEQVERVVRQARAVGYESINFDLIYGLPKQSRESIARTIEHVERLKPDRIAWYAYAHVPWMMPAQKSFERWLPSPEEKLSFYEFGKQRLTEAGYRDIGMDHFALPHDALYKAYESGNLHRNFMGYTAVDTRLLVGLGASSIGDAWNAFTQNEKKIEDYKKAVEAGRLPIIRGHRLHEEDLLIRRHILDLMCRYHTVADTQALGEENSRLIFNALQPLCEDGLVEVKPLSGQLTSIEVQAAGKPFIRNICMAFDLRLHRKQRKEPIFSSTV
ncbi:oxygen-independent coproporphyrinogen III oxidase [Thermonema rossianum]|uniref:oxygen-independent coproporphyrinogen III oxidase n=1 Tax=Thermonema rossianum TaxID=55505 RepID=UPI00056F9DAD|nr:oxygen-independent coproporphyrinogen III oxidase [Thermonema rossianum]